MGVRYTIKEETLEDLADSIRGLTHENLNMNPGQMADKIRSLRLGIPVGITNHLDPETGKWRRPIEYPDLDSIDISDDFDGVYLTYDLRKTPGYGWIGVYVANATNGTPFWVERGHLENGIFITDESHECISSSSTAGTSTRYFRHSLDDEYGDVQLWRVRSNSKISNFKFVANSAVTAECYFQLQQPCVEAVGNLPYDNSLTSGSSLNGTSGSWGTYWLERDARVPGKQKNVTSLNSLWYHCYSLQELDLSKWDTSGWHVTNIGACWQNCRSLPSLDVSGWDTSNWAITTLTSTWNSCFSLNSLDLSSWDTSNWVVTSLASTWLNCYAMVSLNLDGWNTSNWKITTLAATWQNCRSLISLDNIFDFDTTGWVVTSLASTWNSCMKIEKLDLSAWDVSNWAVTSLDSIWTNCYSLKTLIADGWDTSKWAVTDIDSMFAYCSSLESVDLTRWDTNNWPVTASYAVFRTCLSLREVDIGTWDTSKWNLIDSRYLFSECYLLEKAVLPLGMSVDNSNGIGAAHDSRLLIEYNGYQMFYNHSYSNCHNLSHDSLVSIIGNLGVVSAARTITLGQVNQLKLTAQEIAVATQKGWTVA